MILDWLYLFLFLLGIILAYVYCLDKVIKIILWSLVAIIPITIFSLLLGSVFAGLGMCIFIGLMTYYFTYD